MRTAVQQVLNKSGVVFSKVKGPGLFYPFELTFYQEEKLGAFFPLFCCVIGLYKVLNVHPFLFSCVFLNKILKIQSFKCFYTYTLYC